jgi:hypothetical protein
VLLEGGGDEEFDVTVLGLAAAQIVVLLPVVAVELPRERREVQRVAELPGVRLQSRRVDHRREDRQGSVEVVRDLHDPALLWPVDVA